MRAAAKAQAGESEAGASVAIHASALLIGEAGIIIRGESGSGKSSLVLALLSAAAQGGSFARLVGDDRIALRRQQGRLIAQGHERIGGMIERRGQGILRLDYEKRAVVRLVVDIVPVESVSRYPAGEPRQTLLCDVKLPVLRVLKTAPVTDSALIVLAYLRETGTI